MGWRPTVEKRACARSYPLTVHVPDRIASTLTVQASNLCVRVGMKMRGFGETQHTPVQGTAHLLGKFQPPGLHSMTHRTAV